MAFKMRSGNKPGFKQMGAMEAIKKVNVSTSEHPNQRKSKMDTEREIYKARLRGDYQDLTGDKLKKASYDDYPEELIKDYNIPESPTKQTKFPHSPKAMERRKKKQKDFEPAYPGADYSKEDIAKMTEAEKIANIDGYEPKSKLKVGPKKKTKSPAKQVKDNDLKEFLISERGFTPADADRMIKSGAYTKKDIKPGIKRKVIKKGPTIPKPKKSTVSKHGQLSDAQKEYETDMKLYNKQSTGKGGYVKKNKKSPAKQAKQKGLGPRTAFGGVKNPELTGTKKPFSRKVMKDDGGSDWKNRHAVKSDFQKKVEAKKKAWANMTPAQRKAAQDAANDKADKFHKRGKYKVK